MIREKDVVYLALYDNRDPMDIGAKVIKLGTKSSYSHCELCVNDWSYSSSIPDGGVRAKGAADVFKHPENWTFIPLKWINPVWIWDFYQITKSESYSWFGLVLGQVFNFRINAKGYFCSEWVMSALMYGLGVDMNSQLYSPEDAKAFCLAMNEVYM